MSYHKPLGNRIISKRIKDNGDGLKRVGSLYVQKETDQEEKYSRVEVLRVGPGYWSVNGSWVPTTAKKGDVVTVIRLAAYALPKDDTELESDEELVLIQESDIFVQTVATEEEADKEVTPVK